MKKDILVFGRGWYYENKRDGINKLFHVIGFLDNAVCEKSFDKNGIAIYPPNFVQTMNSNTLIMISSTKYYFEMLKQLVELGVNSDRIIFAQSLSPFYDESEKWLFENGYSIKACNETILLANQHDVYKVNTVDEYRALIHTIMPSSISAIQNIQELPLEPLSRQFGMERGEAIDRYYIENFLRNNASEITGKVMEVGDDFYTCKYGYNVSQSSVLHIEGKGRKVIKGNLATGEGINKEMVDCLICTQTIQMIYDLESVVENIHGLLKTGGCALVTMHGIAHLCMSDYKRWGEYWRLTCQSAERLFQKHFKDIQVVSYGNVKAATAFLYGLCQQDLKQNELDENDEQYPVIVAVKVRKT